MGGLPTGMLIGWLDLCTVSVINIGILVSIWVGHLKNRSGLDDSGYRLQRQLIG